MKKHRIGIMHGRLTPPKGRGIQFFPFDNWREEFYLAKDLGLNHIEWIFDLEDYRNNPLWTKSGREEIRETIEKTGVAIDFICADFFMRRPLHLGNNKKGVQVLKNLLKYAKEINAHAVEIPCLDNSSLKTEKHKDIFVKAISKALPYAKKLGVFISLESDLHPKKLKEFKERMDHTHIKITYDSGNSSGLGYDHKEEISLYGEHVINVHIKDRIKGGITMPLGRGSADFQKLFMALKAKKYRGHFTLQAARGKEGKEKTHTSSQIKFVKKYIKKYLTQRS